MQGGDDCGFFEIRHLLMEHYFLGSTICQQEYFLGEGGACLAYEFILYLNIVQPLLLIASPQHSLS